MTTIESAWTTPVSVASPSSVAVRLASNSSNRPRNVATTMCLTANDADECVLSSAQVPVGIPTAGVMVAAIGDTPLISVESD